MISARQLAGALYGVWLLYRFDVRAWELFDKSAKGFWGAYIVAVFLAPLQIAHAILQYDADKQTLTFIPYVIVQLLSYVVTWTLFPFVMLYIAHLLNRAPRYFAYMVPYIWMQMPIGLALFSVQVLTDVHVLPATALEVVSPAVLIAFAVYGTFVAGLGLQIATGTAFGLVVLDYVLGLIADNLITRI